MDSNGNTNKISVDIEKLSSGPLKFYYMWRNMGSDHETALAKVSKREAFRGTHSPHPNCRHTKDELMQMSQALNPYEHNRFFVETYYGGKDPARTLEYFSKGKGKLYVKPDVISTSKPESDSDGNTGKVNVDLEKLGNGPLKFYCMWRNKGFDHETALAKVSKREPFHGTHSPHPNCHHTKDELMQMSQALKSYEYLNERFFVETYYGGKDPASTLECFLKTKAMLFSTLEKNLQTTGELKQYYLFRNSGCTHKKAMFMVRKKVNFSGPHYPHPNCVCSEEQLRHMAQGLVDEFVRDRFVIHTFYGGTDLEDTLQYYLSSLTVKEEPMDVVAEVSQQGKKTPASAHPLPFEPVAKRTRSNPEPGIIPLDSPNHPSKELTLAQLKNYYSLVNSGCSRQEAMIKAKTPGLLPKPVKARCLVPLKELQIMSEKLPTKFREIFIVETFYAGNDPEEIMEFLLRKSGTSPATGSDAMPPWTSHHKLEADTQHTSNEAFSTSNNVAAVTSPVDASNAITGDQKTVSSGSVDPFRDPTVIEVGPIDDLINDKLRYYYLWRNGGFSHEYALSKARSFFNFPGKHVPHPRCKLSQEELKKMSEALADDKLMERFFIHTYYGGKDPVCTMGYFMARHPQQKKVPQPQSQEFPVNSGVGQPLPHTPISDGIPAFTRPYRTQAVGQSQSTPLGQPSIGVPHATVLPYQHQTGGHPVGEYPEIHPPVAGDPGMFYPPSQLHSEAMVSPMGYPSYQHSIIGPPDLEFPPNQFQGAMPNMDYLPPYPTVSFSSYPQAAVGSSAVGYPPNQPETIPPSLPHSATAKTQPQNEEPLGFKHSTDEFPIKVNLQTSSDMPAQPKKSPTVEKPSPTDGSVPVFIVPANYPNGRFSDSQLEAIENSLLEAILEMDDDGTKPSFSDSSRSNGRYGITCIDEFSVNWLRKFVSTYQPWPGASLMLISAESKIIKANAILPLSKDDDDNKILKYIEKQNKGLNVNMWTVVQRWENDSNTCMDLVIDEESANVLQKCSRIHFKLRSAEIITSMNDSGSVSSFGQQHGSDRNGDLSERVPSTSQPPPPSNSPPPPPPKCMLSGKGHPSPPKRPAKTDATVHKSSACSVPTHDRFGHPISKSPPSTPPVQEHDGDVRSWMDWFYSKEELGVAQKSVSKSPSRDRSRSPVICESQSSRDRRKTEGSRRTQRHFRCSSSPEYQQSAFRTSSPDRYVRKSHHDTYSRSPDPYRETKRSRRRDRRCSGSVSSPERPRAPSSCSYERGHSRDTCSPSLDPYHGTKSVKREKRRSDHESHRETKRSRRDRRRSESMSSPGYYRRSRSRTATPDRHTGKSSHSKKNKRTPSRCRSSSSDERSSSSDERSSSRHRKMDSFRRK